MKTAVALAAAIAATPALADSRLEAIMVPEGKAYVCSIERVRITENGKSSDRKANPKEMALLVTQSSALFCHKDACARFDLKPTRSVNTLIYATPGGDTLMTNALALEMGAGAEVVFAKTPKKTMAPAGECVFTDTDKLTKFIESETKEPRR